jgi:translation initiation factor IF-2
VHFGPTPRVEATPQSADQSVTNLIASLSSVPRPANPQEQEVVPYRVEAQPRSFAPEPKPTSPGPADAGGVTQFIRRLADEPLAPLHETPAPAPLPAAPEVKSSPGEFTRMISKAEMDAAIGAAAATPAAQPAPQPTPAPVMQPIAVAVPHVAVPAPPKMPTIPAAAPPVAAAPALPKVPVPAIPAIPAPKGKLESMVPYLVIVNTFLLLVIVLVLVFLIKAH